mgnify:CR=1 FL=1
MIVDYKRADGGTFSIQAQQKGRAMFCALDRLVEQPTQKLRTVCGGVAEGARRGLHG